MSKVTSSLVLLGTAIVSGGATYILTRAKYEKLLRGTAPSEPPKPEEKKPEKAPEPGVSPQAVQEKGNLFDYAKKYNEKIAPYIPESTLIPEIDREYVDEDIFDSMREYTSIDYTMWADHILTDENDKLVDDPELTVGIDAVETFDDREVNGAVYILNHSTRTRYQILKDLRRYSEAFE